VQVQFATRPLQGQQEIGKVGFSAAVGARRHDVNNVHVGPVMTASAVKNWRAA
jgi:hypothetical protein